MFDGGSVIPPPCINANIPSLKLSSLHKLSELTGIATKPIPGLISHSKSTPEPNAKQSSDKPCESQGPE